MSKLILLLTVLFYSLSSLASLPTWLTITTAPTNFDAALCESTLPQSAFDLVGKQFNPSAPGFEDVLIGQKVELSISSPKIALSFDYQAIEAQIKLQTTLAYFTSKDNQLLDMQKYIGYDPLGAIGNKLRYNWGYVEGQGDNFIPIEGVITCQIPNSSDAYLIRISGGVTVYTNNFIRQEKQLKVVSKSQQPLVRGRVKLIRLAGTALDEVVHEVAIKNGKVDTDSLEELDLSAGHYRVELMEPAECADEVINENLVITPDILSSDKPLKFEIKCSYAYDMKLSGYVDDDVQYGSKLSYSFVAKDIITHDATEESEEDYQLGHFNQQYDEQGYPLDTSGKRLTLPMKDSNRDPRVIMASWTDSIELEYAHFENHGDGSIDECELDKSEQNEFGFMRIKETITHPLTQDESPPGSYPYLNVELICHHIEEHGRYDYRASIKISPLVPTIIGGYRIYINSPMNGEAQEELLNSGEAFTQIYAKNSKRGGGIIAPYEASMEFKGHFTKKEMKKRSSGGDDGNDPGDGDNGDIPADLYIFTDPTTLDRLGNQVILSIVVISRDNFVDSISYEVHCLNKNSDEIIDSGRFSHFIPYNPPFSYAQKEFTFKRSQKCKQVKVLYDKEHKFLDKNFDPGREIILDWP